jgi:hypothetical protein
VERGSDKNGARVDEQLQHEVEGLVRSGRTTHAQEWKEPEPSGEDQPDVDRAPEETLVGGVPDATTGTDIEGRSQLAALLGKEVWPATRDELCARAKQSAAPDRVMDLLSKLPGDHDYRNLQEVWSTLGGGAEQQRF